MEEEYEMIEDDIMDEDLEVLIKTSEKNEVLNEFKTEGAKEEMSNVRKKLIHKLEKKYGKKNFQKKLKEIEKNIEKASKLEQVFNNYDFFIIIIKNRKRRTREKNQKCNSLN